jgi:hypothetical protein
MPRRIVKEIYRIRTKEEFIEIIKTSHSFSGALKVLHCDRNSLMKYFNDYNIEIPYNWNIERNILKNYVKIAIESSKSHSMENIMDVLGDIMPEEMQYKIKYKQIENVKNDLLRKIAV